MAIRRNQVRMDSDTKEVALSQNQLPTKLSAEEEQLLALSQKNTKFSRDELIVPRLKILQPLNPEVEEGHSQQVAGAKPGMFYNTASGKLTPGQEGMIVCFIGHQRQVIEWLTREVGGGIVKVWGMDDGWKNKCAPEQRDVLNPVTIDGHTIDKQRSFLLFDINVNTGEYDPSFFNLRSTGNKQANQIATMVSNAKMKLSNGQAIIPPYYYYLYKMTLDRQSNQKGTWWAPRCVKYADEKGAHVPLKSIPNGASIFEQAILMQQHFMEGDLQQTDWEEPNKDLDGDNVAF